jgi:hypothetical protein
MNVVHLKTQPEREREEVGQMLVTLGEAYLRGEVQVLTYTYIDHEGACSHATSEHAKLSEFAYMVAVLQTALHDWMMKS